MDEEFIFQVPEEELAQFPEVGNNYSKEIGSQQEITPGSIYTGQNPKS